MPSDLPTQQTQSPPPPRSSTDITSQAIDSIKSAYFNGRQTRQIVDLILPLIGSTEIDDWPGGLRQQFKAAVPLVERILKHLKQQPGLEGPLKPEIIDDADAVGAWSGDSLVLILFPNPETLMNQVKKLCESTTNPNRLVLLVNPQWSTQGQIVSDFGIFPWQKKAAEDFLSTFSPGYSVQNTRINGDYCQWLYTNPTGWQVFVLTGPGAKENTCIIPAQPERPSYKEVESTLRSLPWTMSSKSLAERIVAEADFIKRTAQAPPPSE